MFQYRAVICAIAKDEGRYIGEWIAHHRAIGFDRIWLYDNDSIDDTAAVAARWPDFVQVVAWPDRPGRKAQFDAYAHFLAEHAEAAEWVMWLDCDEFVNPKIHESIGAFLEDVSGPAIGINWRVFGDNGHAEYAPGLVIERFTRASAEGFGPNHIIKTIARFDAIAASSIHSPVLKDGRTLLSPSGHPLKPAPSVRQDVTEHGLIAVNHYCTKSRGEWRLKRARGMADMPPGHPDRMRDDGFFAVHNKNDTDERSILRFVPRVRALLR